MIKQMKVEDFLKSIPYDDVCHTNCIVTCSADDKCHFFAYVKQEHGVLLRTFSFKSFWSVMQKLDDVASKLNIRVAVKTPLFRKSMLDDFPSFNVGM